MSFLPFKKVFDFFRSAKILKIALLLSALNYSLNYSSFLSATFPVRPTGNIDFGSLRPKMEVSPSVNGSRSEVFGFVPYWKIGNLKSVDFNVLTTLAYFGISVGADGRLDRADRGFATLKSPPAAAIFKRAKDSGARVVMTLTQMNNDVIRAFLSNENAQSRAIAESLDEMISLGLDGINVDFEYVGNPGSFYRDRLTSFVSRLTKEAHSRLSGSYITVSLYASSAKEPKIYDVGPLSEGSDGLFIMAYDFAVKGAKVAMPTAPLYGYKEGKYWYDVSSAVDDFLIVASPSKLILGVPWYGYNYPIYAPAQNPTTHQGYYYYYGVGKKRRQAFFKPPSIAQTYSDVIRNIAEGSSRIRNLASGWDDVGQVGWRSYFDAVEGVWRMIFAEDTKSLSLKYDFVKEKNLAGVGIWALGFEEGSSEFWDLLQAKFGSNYSNIELSREGNGG